MSLALDASLGPLLARIRRERDRVELDRAGKDEEAIHDYRVALRRLRTMLRPLRPLFGKSKVRAAETELQRFADRTGDLREEEVLAETLRSLRLSPSARSAATRWLAVRAPRLARKRRTIARELAVRGATGAEPLVIDRDAPPPTTGGHLDVVLDAIEALIAAPPRTPRTRAELAREALGKAVAEVRAFADEVDPGDVASMHALRIRFKRLRYTAELLGPEMELTDAVARSAARMQKVLGTLHDLDDAAATIGRARALAPSHRVTIRAVLERRRETTARRAMRELVRELSTIEASTAGASA